MALRDLIPWRRRMPLRNRLDEDPHVALHERLDHLFDDLWTGFGLEPFGAGLDLRQAFSPKVNLTEEAQQILLTAELPGVEEEDLEVSVTDEALTIAGQKKQEQEHREGNSWRRERSFGRFERTLPLPAEVLRDQVEAHYQKGVLTVRLPKTEKARAQSRRIPVRTE